MSLAVVGPNCDATCATNTATWANKCANGGDWGTCHGCAICLIPPPRPPPSPPPILENTAQGQIIYIGGAAVFLLIIAVVRPLLLLAALAAAPSRDPHSLLESPHRQAAYKIHVRAKLDTSAVERWQDADVPKTQSKMRKGVGPVVRVSAASSASRRPRNPAMITLLFVFVVRCARRRSSS